MSEYSIKKTQANQVFQILQKHGLPPEEFKWETVPSIYIPYAHVSKLVHVPTDFYFLFDFRDGKHWCRFSPGEHAMIDSQFPGGWPFLVGYFETWAATLKKEIDAPDLWAAIANEKVLSETFSADQDNTAFTSDEQARLGKVLFELRHYLLSSSSFTNEQTAYLDSHFKHLEEATTRIGRKDWILLAVGTFTNIIIGIGLQPDIARELFRLAGTLLKWLAVRPLLI